MYCNLCSKMTPPPCHTLLTTSHIFSIITCQQLTLSRASRAPYSSGSSFSERGVLSPFAITPSYPPSPRPTRPSPKALWCVTSHRTLKAVKSQFSDKSNLNLSGDTIYRSDRDRAARVPVILNEHLEANATFVWSISSAARVDSPDKDAMME